MTWPPQIGEPLPRGEDGYNVHQKLRDYSLAMEHHSGRNKALGFLQILGISLADLDHLATAVLDGVHGLPVTRVRDNPPCGLNCNVIISVRGLGAFADRVAPVPTSWELRYEGDRPRL